MSTQKTRRARKKSATRASNKEAQSALELSKKSLPVRLWASVDTEMVKRVAPPVLLGAAALGIGFWLFRRVWESEAFLSDEIAHRLPVSKKLDTIADSEGNYDIDGVSFDTEGVIISSDGVKPVTAPI